MVKLRRKRSAAIEESDALVLPIIRRLKAEHPFWGYRRIWAYLSFVERIVINKKRVYRLLRENNLLVKGNEKLKARRVSKQSKPRPDRPNSWWGIDMTKVLTREGWAYLVVVNDWFTKKILGAFVADRSRASDWLEAVNEAVCRQFPSGIREVESLQLHLMSDNGSQPTSVTFMKECRAFGIRQAFTAYANPKGNADTERLIRTIKEELCWLREWSSVTELAIEMEKFVEYFNGNYLHSALGYKTPNAFEAEWFKNNQITHSATA
ncbi:MAG: IS3 family transposase [Acidobacteria bacterium]|nr:IS3 family transposase [Acidobacteriota bacterium]MCA1638493.1 IS3 family transposase [Acidobacteriota bacterium]